MAANSLHMAALHRPDAPAPTTRWLEAARLPFGATAEWAVARRVDTRALPAWQRPIYVLCHRIMRMPASILTTRGTMDFRAQAEAACVDEHDYIYLQPHGAVWGIEASAQELIGLCFPKSLDPYWRAVNERDREYYLAVEGERALLKKAELERAAEAITEALAVDARARECLARKREVFDRLSELNTRLTRLEVLHPEADDHAARPDST